MTDIQKLRELLAKATPGPWKQWPYDTTLIVKNDTMASSKTVADAPLVADAALIVAAVNALPELLDELERLRDALDEIAAHYNGGITGPGRIQADSMREIARAALKGNGDD